MQEAADRELLRQYVLGNSQEAFAALVSRYVNLVYSVALRKTGSPQTAEDITQAVFIILAKKARALRDPTALSGWLYHTARLTAANYLKTEIRRARREQDAYMQTLANDAESEVWPQISPILDDAMARLGAKDRDAVVLRFFKGKSFQDIALATGASENAAKKRVHYALEKLRRYFAKQGVVSAASTLGGAIAAHSVQAAPEVLVKTAAVAALSKGAAASASTLALVKATLKSLFWAKVKSAAGWGGGLLAVGAAVTLAVVNTNGLSTASAPFQFSAEGICRFTAFNRTGVETTDYPFTVAVSNNLWFMRITDVRSNAVAGYFEIGCDGRRTYYVDYQEAWAKAATLQRGTGYAENVAVGIIGPQEVPHFPFAPQAGAIWLAYASGRYFDAATSSRLQPAATLLVQYGRNVQPNSFALQRTLWSRRERRPGVPVSAVYLDDGIAGLRNGAPVRWPAPLDAGFTNAVFQTLESTNIAGLALPTRATLVTFAPQLGDPAPRVVRRFSYEIIATNLTTQLLHTDGFKPRLPGVTYVNDMRFSTPANDLHVNYYVSDGHWLTDDQVKRLPEFAVAVAHAGQTGTPFSRSAARGGRQIVWVLLALLAVLPVVLFFRERRRRGQ